MAQSKATKDSGAMVFSVVVILLTLVGAGSGFAVGAFLDRQSAAGEAVATAEEPEGGTAVKAAEAHPAPEPHGTTEATKADDPAADDEEVLDPEGLKVIAFPPVLTTLSHPKGRWIRLEGSILLTAEARESPEILAERAGEQVLTYLRTLRLEQIEGPSNVLALREDLTEMLRVLSGNQIKGILINGLVVE